MNYDQIITTITSIVIMALVSYAVNLIERMVIKHETFANASIEAFDIVLKSLQQAPTTVTVVDDTKQIDKSTIVQ